MHEKNLSVDLSAFKPLRVPQRPVDPGPFPAHLIDVPGLVGEVVAYNLATATRHPPAAGPGPGRVFRGKAYADCKRNRVLDQPCVSVYGTTVPEHFFESLTADSLNDVPAACQHEAFTTSQ